MTVIGHVARINRYPVKSMQGEQVARATLGPLGIEGDRRWALTEDDGTRLLSAKRHADLLLARARTTENGPEITLPNGTVVSGADPATASKAISDWLGRPVRLTPASEVEHAPPAYEMSFDVASEDHDVFSVPVRPGAFMDLAGVHVLTTTSLASAAAAHTDGAWSVDRFRPTLLLELDQATAEFPENDWIGRRLRIGDAEIGVSMPTIRCVMTTRAQPDLPRDLRIFTTLNAENSANLGVYGDTVVPGEIAARDPVELLDSEVSRSA